MISLWTIADWKMVPLAIRYTYIYQLSKYPWCYFLSYPSLLAFIAVGVQINQILSLQYSSIYEAILKTSL